MIAEACDSPICRRTVCGARDGAVVGKSLHYGRISSVAVHLVKLQGGGRGPCIDTEL